MSPSEIIMNMATKLCETMDADSLSRVAIEYAKREPNAGQEAVMDVISMSLAKRLPYDEFKKVMIQVNIAIDEQGKNFHKGVTNSGDTK